MRVKIAIFATISTLIPTILYTNYVIFYFFSGRATLLDAGWFSYLLTHSLNWSIDNPTILHSAKIGVSFLTTHMSLFFHFLSIVYNNFFSFIPPYIYFAIFIGLSFGIISLAVFIAGLKLLPKIELLYLTLLTLISIFTSFNGVALALIGFPHIEIAIASLILLFIALYFSGYKRLSFLPLLFVLTIREDAGLHLFALLIMILLIQIIYIKSIKKIDYTLLTLATISLIYSISIIAIQKIYFPGDNALIRIYLGKPIFAHLTTNFIEHRINFLLHNREYIYIPALATIILAIFSRNLFLLASLLATLPWVALSLTAITDMPGTLSNYYAFPLIITLSWPIPAFLIYKVYINSNSNKSKAIIISVIAITILSTALFPNNRGNADNRVWRGFYFTDIKKISDTEHFLSILKKHKSQLGNILFGETLSAFMVDNLKKDEYGYLNRFFKTQIDNADTVIYYIAQKDTPKPAYKVMPAIIKKRDMRYIYRVKGTDIAIASRIDLKKIFNDYLQSVPIEALAP